jgi:L-fuculose-phosphate aldolase
MSLTDARRNVIELSRRLRPDGLVVGTSGNISIRYEDSILITPTGLDYDQLTVDDICVLSLSGEILDGRLKPSTETPMHLAAYRDDSVWAVVHTHSPYATALSTVIDELPPIHYMMSTLGPSVRVAPYATPASTELAEAMQLGLTNRLAVILQNHGTITVGATAAEAYRNAVNLEWLAALYYRARLLGSPRILNDSEMEMVGELMRTYGAQPLTPA